MVGIAEHELQADRIGHPVVERLQCAVRSDRDEIRRIDDPMRRVDSADCGRATWRNDGALRSERSCSFLLFDKSPRECGQGSAGSDDQAFHEEADRDHRENRSDEAIEAEETEENGIDELGKNKRNPHPQPQAPSAEPNLQPSE